MNIVIVGGGIVGTAIAYYLRDADASVVLLEKNQLGAGTTGKSTAVFGWRLSHPADYHFRKRCWTELRAVEQDDSIDRVTTGHLTVARTAEYLDRLKPDVTTRQAYGLDFELLEPSALPEYGVDPEAAAGGMYTPLESYTNPQDLVEHFAARAAENGVEVRTGVALTDVHVDGGAVDGVDTSAGTISADVVVNAAGPWAAAVDELAGVSLPLRNTDCPILVLRTESPVDMPYTMIEGSNHYFRPEGPRTILAGRRAYRFSDATTVDPDDAHAVDPAFYRNLPETIAEFLPALEDAEVVNDWVGFRTHTPDSRPMVGETVVDGYHVATGMSGGGISRATGVGRLLADRLTGERGGGYLDVLSPGRFDGVGVPGGVPGTEH